MLLFIGNTLVVVGILLILGAIYMMFRNIQVYKFRIWLINQVSLAAAADINNGLTEWRWRSETFNTVTYNTMMFKFWKPLKPGAWYADTSFLEASHD